MNTRRYAAFLRGVSPMNAKMPALKKCFEAAGFQRVQTVLSSGNVVFDARPSPPPALQRQAEAAMREHLGQAFLTIVRPVDSLQRLLDSDPYRPFRLPAGAKRVVTFLRDAPPKAKLPVALGRARILCLSGREAFSAYLPGDKGPLFMTLIERTFGREVTTRTWDTVRKVAAR
jgi:uncharacterized protein (DUF1697 family)